MITRPTKDLKPEKDEQMATYMKLGRDTTGGWIKISRQICDHPVVGFGTGNLEPWLWLLLRAGWEGEQRGKVYVSVRRLGPIWGWTYKRTRCFLALLEAEKMIEIGAQPRAQVGAQLTICNYDKYQVRGRSQGRSQGRSIKEQRRKPRINTSPIGEVRDLTVATPALDEFSVSMAVKAWNALAERCGLPECNKLTPARKQKLLARLRENGGCDGWTRALAAVERSAFCRGDNNRGWRASFDFILQ